MKRQIIPFLIVSLSAGCATTALAQNSGPSGPGPAAVSAAPPSVPTAMPPSPPPGTPPPAAVLNGVNQNPADGQWAYTTQYGWVWMPYGAEYVSASEGLGVVPTMYVYTPIGGWRWVAAPWVWGIGPTPWFAVGPAHFTWYERPWWGSPYAGCHGRTAFRWSRHG
jgi:hypothetical protein